MDTFFRSMKYVCFLLLFCGCGKPVPDGAYRVEVEKTVSKATSITRVYAIETASLRRFVLEERSGANSVSIGPDIMTKERTGVAQATVTAELEGAGEDTPVVIKMDVTSRGGIARAEELLALPGVTDLSSVLVETEAIGDLTAPITLLRIDANGRYLQIVIK
ncbi:MAG: hypothetical protein ACI8W8_003277 [Rhodothermales bacterium]|jgi:hypothetical protein